MSGQSKAEQRYQLREVLGRGGMGIVYRAWDTLMKREVALKTLLDLKDREVIDLFYKEWGVLSTIVHPNIIEIYDIGELDDDGAKPYFVMPLLPGRTLDKIIRDSSHRLDAGRAVDIICQTCRGLQVAHERGLVHRDLKPSNIFVMEDNSVKLIDFGIVHLTHAHSTTGLKGTLVYMSPEQVQMKRPTAASDIFSLGVVAYETLTRRRPFQGSSEAEVAHAIVHDIPPLASDINPSVGQAVSQTIHKAMAKQPWHRFATAREFSETLLKAYRNEPIEIFDPARIQPRVERAARAFESGDLAFASEVLAELEAEGHMDHNIAQLRRRLDQTQRQNTIRQLLDTARRYYQQQEYQLALRKIQEALQLDPSDAEALTLKSIVEKERRERKADEWQQLARQHLDNKAFHHARHAIESILSIKPNDPAALALKAETDRLEQEYMRARQRKSEVYDSALRAWQKGEVSAALSRLERLIELENNAPDSDVSRTSAYRSLYNQVRTEHDAIKNAYETARGHLAAEELEQALAICGEFLAKYPSHALFQALKYDVEERRRQRLSAYIAETDRKVEGEPDLDRRLSIIEEALRRYPGETHFQSALRLVRDKRDLVQSILSRARLHEEAGQFNEALDQWKILQTIHPRHPGLEFEIERLQKRREQQNRAEAKARWVEQIDSLLESGDAERALEHTRNALKEFPDDAELRELVKQAEQARERGAEARRLLQEAGSLREQRDYARCLELLRTANELDPRNLGVRAALLDTLVEQARGMIDTEWRAAGQLLDQALALDPGHPPARSLREIVNDHEREAAVVWCTSQARRLQGAGDLPGACAILQQGLASYPHEPRLRQLQNALARAMADHGLAQATAASLPVPPPAAPAADEFETFLLEQAGLREGPSGAAASPPLPPREGAPPPAAEPAPASKPPAGASPAAAAPAARPAAVGTDSPAKSHPLPPAVKVSDAFRDLATQLSGGGAQLRETLRRTPRGVWIAGGAVALILMVIALAFGFWKPGRRSGGRPLAAMVSVRVQTIPSGAAIRIDGKARGVSNLELELPAGEHRLEASLEGYQTQVETIQVSGGAATSVSLSLAPDPAAVALVASLEGAQAWLDGQEAGPVEDGELRLEKVEMGDHVLRVSGREGEASIAFRVDPASEPVLYGPPQVNTVTAIILTSFGNQATVFCSCIPASASLDGKRIGDVDSGGLDLGAVSPGVHELTVGEGDKARRVAFEMRRGPSMAIFLHTENQSGALVVVTGEDDALIYLNDKVYRRATRRGQVRIPDLPPGRYRVRAGKEGFLPEPEQQVELGRGMETTVRFQLRPVAQKASLQIRGAIAGAEVLVDGAAAGRVAADGSFSTSLSPGEHSIELRKQSYRPRHIRRDFAAGQTVTLVGSDVALERGLGILRYTVYPEDARVTVRLKDEPESKGDVVRGGTVSLAEGHYVVSAGSAGHNPENVVVEIAAGEVRTVEMRLKPAAEPPRPVAEPKTTRPPVDMSGWDDPSAWVRQNRWLVRRGGDFVTFRENPVRGVFSFIAFLQRGRRLQWFANWSSPKNYALFQMDRHDFYRKQVVNGKIIELAKLSHPEMRDNIFTVRVEVTPTAIIHQILYEDQWIMLDAWNDPNQRFDQGKFGFLIPGRDEYGLANFRYQPK